MMTWETSVSLVGFGAGALSIQHILRSCLPDLTMLSGSISGQLIGITSPQTLAGIFVAKSAIDVYRKPRMLQVVAPAALIGAGFGTGLAVMASSERFFAWGAYMTTMSFFHMSEYLMTAVFHPDTVNFDSFLLNHSKPYAIAAIASWIEFWGEFALFPSLKSDYVTNLGLAMCIGGEGIRKLAMYTASSNFTHIVADEHLPDHVLVTNGIYRLSRHPGYMGWFWWSVGTQFVLCNPICAIGYAVASWRFFSDRIMYEEYQLIKFFGMDYLNYQKKVGTGIPGIAGLNELSEAEVKLIAHQD